MEYAIINSENLVINTIMWDGETPWNPPEGCQAVLLPVPVYAGIGWTYSDGTFIEPNYS